MLGWQPEEWMGRAMSEFGHPDDLDTVVAAREEMLSGTSVVMRIRIKDRSGVFHWAEVHSRLYINAEGNIDGIQSSMRTIDKEVQAEQDLERRARYDDLTGVFKRDEAIARLSDVTSHRRVPGTEAAALFIDIDGFKHVNDTYGHAAGDAVLETLTVRIREIVRASDTIARMGGDEFVVILDGIHDIHEARAVAEKIRLAAARPVATATGAVDMTVSIGVTLTTSLESADQVIARADAAMYQAKNGGRDRIVAI
jgi:diguanylate cyclase (GGDEF)-like protein/PAS domain S-box-containing protein